MLSEVKRISLSLSSIGPWTAIAACGWIAVADLVLSLVTPDYDPLSQTTSKLMSAGARYAALTRISLAVYCVLLIPFVFSVTRRPAGRQPWVLLMKAGLWVHILAGLMAAGFENDSAEELISGIQANDIHDASGQVMYGVAAFVVAASALARHPSLYRLAWLHFATVGVMVLFGLAVALGVTPFRGIEERLGFIAFLVWFALFALRSTRARPSGPPSAN